MNLATLTIVLSFYFEVFVGFDSFILLGEFLVLSQRNNPVRVYLFAERKAWFSASPCKCVVRVRRSKLGDNKQIQNEIERVHSHYKKKSFPLRFVDVFTPIS